MLPVYYVISAPRVSRRMLLLLALIGGFDASHRLPKEGEENILITSALPYCNNVPHLGEVSIAGLRTAADSAAPR